jgi:hypothetical protein
MLDWRPHCLLHLLAILGGLTALTIAAKGAGVTSLRHNRSCDE